MKNVHIFSVLRTAGLRVSFLNIPRIFNILSVFSILSVLSVMNAVNISGFTGVVNAQTVWTGAAGSSLTDAGNWNNGVPTAANPGTININVTELTDTSVPGNASITVNGGASVTTAANNQLNLNAGSNLIIGGGSAGTVTSTYFTRLVGSSTAPGVLTVGKDGEFTCKSYFLIGVSGSHYGTLLIDGGTVNANSNSFTIGDNGHGTVTLNSGTLNVGTTFEIGNHTGSSGTINMYGGTMKVTGGFHIGGGDSLTSANKSTGVFNYYGGTLTSSNTIYVGYGPGAVGTLNVKAGADMTLSQNTEIGVTTFTKDSSTYTSTGNLILEAGTAENHTSLTTSKNISVATNGIGNLTVNSNADFTSTGTLSVAANATGVGTVAIKNGGTANLKTLLLTNSAGASGTVNVEAGGTLNFVDGSAINGGAGNGSLNISGSASATGAFSVAFTSADTAINVKDSGTLSLSFPQIDGSYKAMYLGDGTGKTAVLNVTGSAKLTMTSPSAPNAALGVGGNNGKGYIYYNSSAASEWNATLRLGWGGGTSEGFLYIQDGTVTHKNGYVIVASSAKGHLEVSGDARFTCNNLFVGDSATSGVGSIAGDILVKDSATLNTNVVYLADKNGTLGTFTASDSSSVTVGDVFRVGHSQHYSESGNTSYQGGGSANLTVSGGTVKCGYLELGNLKTTNEVNILSGTFQTTNADVTSTTFGDSKITLAGGDATTVSFAGPLSLGAGTDIRIQDGTSLTGKSLTFNGNSNVEIDGLYTFADLTGALTYNGTGNTLTIHIDDPYMTEGTYTLIDAASAAGKLDAVTLISSMGTTILAADSPYLLYANGLALNYSGAVAPLPEPAAWLLLLCGAGMLAAFRRRRFTSST